ncbi:MAG TPA: NAD(+) kinase [Gammaproteobacteria bacterium]|nr:NAD(+) kinase [Gammaproteobacteria bacterium]
MSNAFHTIGLIGKHEDPSICESIRMLGQYLQGRDLEVLLDEESCRSVPDHGLKISDRAGIGRSCDLAIVVGGDGTMLTAARSLADYSVPLLGINLGRMGFLTDISPPEMMERLDEILSGEYKTDERFLLHCYIEREGEELNHSNAFNDVVVHKINIAPMIELTTYVDGQFVNNQRLDGLIVATPTGSTAYALSAGGPIIQPSMNALALVPLSPHTLSYRPLILTGDSRIEILVSNTSPNNAQVTSDGQTNFVLAVGDRIVIHKKEQRVRLIHPMNYYFYDILRAKLHWG